MTEMLIQELVHLLWEQASHSNFTFTKIFILTIMKYNSFKNIVASLIISGIMSCSALEENPDFPSVENFYKTEADARAGINGIYDYLGNGWGNLMYARYVWDCALGYSTGYEKEPLAFWEGNYESSNWLLAEWWSKNYKIINLANSALSKIPSIQLEDNLKNRLLGEARFLRGFAYYHLASYHDSLPIYTEPTQNFDAAKGLSPKSDAFQIAIQDFTEAGRLLPVSHSGVDLGRANRWAAFGFLAKAYLETGQWSEARTAAENVINNAGIQLFPNYAHNFDVAHENQGERIFELQSSWSTSQTGEYNNIHAHFTPPDFSGVTCSNKTNTASGWSDAWLHGTSKFRESYDSNDNRIAGTFLESYCSRNVNDLVTWSASASSPFVGQNSAARTYKSAYVAKTLDLAAETNWDRASDNFPLLRYADVLLAHSEAANESQSGDAFMGINRVRTRAGLSTLSGLDQTALRAAIIQERIYEFAFEGQTFPNLRRAGEAAFRQFAETYLNRSYVPRDFVLPFPATEVEANPRLQQHPSWR